MQILLGLTLKIKQQITVEELEANLRMGYYFESKNTNIEENTNRAMKYYKKILDVDISCLEEWGANNIYKEAATRYVCLANPNQLQYLTLWIFVHNDIKATSPEKCKFITFGPPQLVNQRRIVIEELTALLNDHKGEDDLVGALKRVIMLLVYNK